MTLETITSYAPRARFSVCRTGGFILIALVCFVVAKPALAAQGDILGLNGDGFTFVDAVTGNEYNFGLAAEQTEEEGAGVVTMRLDGPGLSLCTTFGPDAIINPPPIDCGLFFPCLGGDKPLPQIECGTAFEMSVSINRCRAGISFHGFVHSDHPLVTYMGMATFDIQFRKTPGQESGQIKVTVHTPKEQITFGPTSISPVSDSPLFLMPSCP